MLRGIQIEQMASESSAAAESVWADWLGNSTQDLVELIYKWEWCAHNCCPIQFFAMSHYAKGSVYIHARHGDLCLQLCVVAIIHTSAAGNSGPTDKMWHLVE